MAHSPASGHGRQGWIWDEWQHQGQLTRVRPAVGTDLGEAPVGTTTRVKPSAVKSLSRGTCGRPLEDAMRASILIVEGAAAL